MPIPTTMIRYVIRIFLTVFIEYNYTNFVIILDFQMLPITGNRYHCRDCKGISGFDLCEQCYRNSLKLPGRFNHSSEHKFNKISGARISFAGVLQIDEQAPVLSPSI